MQKRFSVLLIDDNEVDFVITRSFLAQIPEHTYDLDWVESYEVGMRTVARGHHDVVLLDYDLGDRSGLDFLGELKRRAVETPVILLTGLGDPDVDEQALALGASGYVDKRRIDAGDLDRSLRYALERGRELVHARQERDELSSLHRLTEGFLGGQGPDEFCERAAREIAREYQFPACTIELLEKGGEHLRLIASVGLDKMMQGTRYPIGSSIGGEVLQSGVPFLESKIVDEGEPVYPGPLGIGVRTMICVPLSAGNRTLGAVTLADQEARVMDSLELRRLVTLTRHLARLLERSCPEVTSIADATPAVERRTRGSLAAR